MEHLQLDLIIKMPRNKQFDLMLFWGIMMVIMGHNYQPSGLFVGAYEYHMALFFVITGYFFKIEPTYHLKFVWIWKKIKSQLVPYFLLNTLFSLIAFYLYKKQLPLGSDFTIDSFFIQPFIHGHQNSFFFPAWFLIQLFVVGVSLQLMFFYDNDKFKIFLAIILFIALIATQYLAKKQYFKLENFNLLFVRSFFSAFFVVLGVLLKHYQSGVNKYLLNYKAIIICVFIIYYQHSFISNFHYEIVWGAMGEYILPSIFNTIMCILLVYIVSHYLAAIIKDDSFIFKIAQNTFSIMSFHMLIIISINILLYYLRVNYIGDLYFLWHKPVIIKYIWPLYFISALIIPVWLAISYNYVLSKIKSKINV